MVKIEKYGRSCPDELQGLFDVLNDLPVGQAAIDRFERVFYQLQEKAIELQSQSMKARENSPPEFTEKDCAELDRQGRNFKKIREWYKENIVKLKHPIVALKIGLTTEWGSELRLQELYNEKAVLRSIVESFQKWESTTRRLNLSARYELKITPREFGFNEDSSIKTRDLEIWELLTRDHIPIERIGICPQCQKFHWKKKLGISKTCGNQKCADAQNHQDTKKKEGKS